MVTLEPMSEEEYARFDARMWEEYAQERARNSLLPIEEEREIAMRQRETLLPQGLRTPGHFFWNVVAGPGGVVGHLWVLVEREKRQAFIYDIEIAEAHRRKGYGERTLAALEAAVRPLGIARIALNVFGDNATAKRLYERVGYRTVATAMQKELD